MAASRHDLEPGDAALREAVCRHAVPLRALDDVDAIVAQLADEPLVLLGEATHGTHEFYRLRAEISKRLIVEHGFDAVAVEADWPDALRVSRWVQGLDGADNIDQALGAFERFPRWMWRNHDTRDFLLWLQRCNASRPGPSHRVGFFGVDLYSLGNSMQAVIDYLEQADPRLAAQARQRYACFDSLAADPQRYGQATGYGLADDCEPQVVEQLVSMLAHTGHLLNQDGADELFYAQQNARVVRGAEQYYRTLYRGGALSWNLRDTHMADTLDALRDHLSAQRGRPAKIVVWAHNSHLGDAGATEMGRQGQTNLGQLMRQRHGRAVFLLGFSTHTGTVAAARDWDAPVERRRVCSSLPGSVERLFHDAGLQRALVPLRGPLHQPLAEPLLERAIGVIYRPDTERWSHYFETRLSQQFDAVVHVDHTHAVVPLDAFASQQPVAAEEETYPSGL